MRYYDAHCHLQDRRISAYADDIISDYGKVNVARSVVNGTSEEDWDRVAELVQRSGKLIPSFGLHPWFVQRASPGWKTALSALFKRFPSAGVGEIGLDCWIEGHDLDAQREAFDWQINLAAEENRPTTLHCLNAWGPLQKALSELPLPARGFLMHSYGGSREMMGQLLARGAYFSISGYFALEKKRKQRDVLRRIPLERLLLETDAPDMPGPEEYRVSSFEPSESALCNHPLNIIGVYRFAAELFDLDLEKLAGIVEENFLRFYGIREAL